MNANHSACIATKIVIYANNLILNKLQSLNGIRLSFLSTAGHFANPGMQIVRYEVSYFIGDKRQQLVSVH